MEIHDDKLEREVNVSTGDTGTTCTDDSEQSPFVGNHYRYTLRRKDIDTEVIVFEIQNFTQLKSFLLWKI